MGSVTRLSTDWISDVNSIRIIGVSIISGFCGIGAVAGPFYCQLSYDSYSNYNCIYWWTVISWR